jgi:hypothetical protein
MGLKSRVSKAFRPTTTQTDPTKRPAPNVLDRDFTATRPNQKWVTCHRAVEMPPWPGEIRQPGL